MLTALVIVGAATIFPVAMKFIVETPGERRRWLQSLWVAFGGRRNDGPFQARRHS